MSDGAEPHAAVTWIGDERAKLEGQRARLERQIEALAEAEAALMRYAELAGQDVDCRRTQAAGTGEDGALEVLLQAPMPVVEEAAAPPAAPVRVGPERDYAGSRIANAPPIFEGRDLMRARIHDRAGDDRFVAALAPALSAEARQRAKAVRVQEGDPAAQLLG